MSKEKQEIYVLKVRFIMPCVQLTPPPQGFGRVCFSGNTALLRSLLSFHNLSASMGADQVRYRLPCSNLPLINLLSTPGVQRIPLSSHYLTRLIRLFWLDTRDYMAVTLYFNAIHMKINHTLSPILHLLKLFRTLSLLRSRLSLSYKI